MSSEAHFRWTSSASSHVGMVRQVNEDACLDQPERGLWVVADGMGGHTRGDVASRIVVDCLNRLGAPEDLAKFAAQARQQLQIANRELRMEAALRDAQIIGSTVVVLLACGRHCTYIWAGDSRIYLYRCGQLTQLSRDHKPAEEIRLGPNADADTIVYPQARNLITRAVGAADTLELDEDTIEVIDGDMFLLCSDGVSNEISDTDMVSAMVAGNCRQASEALIDLALYRGGHDNISAIVVRADDLYSTEKTILNPALSR